jgi:hypothetical protein
MALGDVLKMPARTVERTFFCELKELDYAKKKLCHVCKNVLKTEQTTTLWFSLKTEQTTALCSRSLKLE